MTEIEVISFVKEHIVSRMAKLSDAQRGDWIRAVRNYSVEVATKAVLSIVDADERLSIGALRHKCWEFSRPERDRNSGAIGDTPIYGYVKCLQSPSGHPDWESVLYPVALPRCHMVSKDTIHGYLQVIASQFESANGGRWAGVLSEGESLLDDDGATGPAASALAKERILAGPDCVAQKALRGWARRPRMGNLATTLPTALAKMGLALGKPESQLKSTPSIDDEPLPDWMSLPVPKKYIKEEPPGEAELPFEQVVP